MQFTHVILKNILSSCSDMKEFYKSCVYELVKKAFRKPDIELAIWLKNHFLYVNCYLHFYLKGDLKKN